MNQELHHNVLLLKNTIQSQMNAVHFTSPEFTLAHKLCMYQAFLNLIEKYPEKMVCSLFSLKKNTGLQHKIFQEYISLLEKKIPFSFKKNGKFYQINSLLDPELTIFDGVSVFDAIVSPKKEIKNNTKEFYVGGRKGAYSKIYYIGKVLDIINLENKQSIVSDILEYSFSKIKMKTTSPKTNVQVIHLRIPPHYQMGGMLYLNRIKQKITDEIKR